MGWAVLVARLIAVIAPTLYCGMTLQYSTIFVQPIIEHAPTPTVAVKQWLRGYQMGPAWVPATVLPGTICNMVLARVVSTRASTDSIGNSTLSSTYITSALLLVSIAPITFFYMEPGINGALKWKAQLLLGESEGFRMAETSIWAPSAWHHGSTRASRRRAAHTEVTDLVCEWRRVNDCRWILGGVAAVLSGWATLVQMH